MATFFTADTHFGHENVIKHSRRPFADVDEMNAALRQNWNARVTDKDDIYIMGDFFYKGSGGPTQIIKQLNGRKHLIRGNHDGRYLKDAAFREQFVEIVDLLNLNVDGKHIILCHYPIAEWPRYFQGSWHIHGHIHNRRGETFEFLRTKERALNAGADITHFSPVTFDELKTYNYIFKAQEPCPDEPFSDLIDDDE